MVTTKAVILEDGEVVSRDYLEGYAAKDKGSNKLPSDVFGNTYEKDGLIEPLYNLEALAQLLEINTYHYRAVKTKARDTAGLGWSMIPCEHVEKDASQEQKDIAQDFLNSCNPLYTLTEINDKVMVDFEATGNAYFEIIRDKEGNLTGIEHLPSHTMRVHKSLKKYAQVRGDKKVWFKLYNYEKDVDYKTGEEHALNTLDHAQRATEVMQLKNYTSRSDYYGVPDVVPALSAILGDKERQEYNTSFFDNHAIPAYAVTVTGAELDEKTENQIKKFFQQDVKKSNHSTLVLTAKKDDDATGDPIKFDFQALSTDVKEASFRMFRQDNRDEILSAHGVPPYRAGITVEGQLGGSSAKESTEIYKQSIIKPKQEMLETRISRFILHDGLGVTDWDFKFNEIDTRDEDREIERLKKLFDMGYYSPNMLREERGEENVDNEHMDNHFINGQPIEYARRHPSSSTQSVVQSMKKLQTELVQIAKKDNEKADYMTISFKDMSDEELRNLSFALNEHIVKEKRGKKVFSHE